jgi:hypothetical protein
MLLFNIYAFFLPEAMSHQCITYSVIYIVTVTNFEFLILSRELGQVFYRR